MGERMRERGSSPASMHRKLLWLLLLIRVVSMETESGQGTQLRGDPQFLCSQ